MRTVAHVDIGATQTSGKDSRGAWRHPGTDVHGPIGTGGLKVRCSTAELEALIPCLSESERGKFACETPQLIPRSGPVDITPGDCISVGLGSEEMCMLPEFKAIIYRLGACLFIDEMG